jgi:flagellar assembly factor FliW
VGLDHLEVEAIFLQNRLEADKVEENLEGPAKGATITFPDGLVGCPEWQHFVLVETEDDVLQNLVSLDKHGVSFLVVPPECICEGYEVDLSTAEQEKIGLENSEDAILLCTLTVREDPFQVTANLAGPIVINRKTMLAEQLVVQDDRYSLRHPVAVGNQGE